jgi:hypothetical protein
MDSYRVLFRLATGINLLSPLLPVAAAVIQFRTKRYREFPGQHRLLALLIYGLFINWGMVGLSLARVHNAWLADPAYAIESLLMLWVLEGVSEGGLPKPVLLVSAAAMLLGVAWDAQRLGLRAMWPVAETTAGILVIFVCLWLLFTLLTEIKPTPIWQLPTFWLYSSWTLIFSVALTFYPLRTLFLRHLSRDWILVPWFCKYAITLVLNLGIARTFLCPKPSSS